MFENLTERLSHTLKKITGQATLTDENIKDALREVRMALLEADVALSVVKEFIEKVKIRAIGQEVTNSLSPGQVFIKIVNDELQSVMGEVNDELDLATRPPAVILMAGLQGAGKTTSVAKLARWLKERKKKSVMVVSADIYRPAAIKQLETLAGEVDAVFHPSAVDQDPIAIAQSAMEAAGNQHIDVLIVDTAGRLHIDVDMMSEIKRLHAAVNPIETLFVVDAMTGQDAANTAKAFNDALPLTGVILTKTDGDARGGAALSVRAITGKPIKFLGVGEKTDGLEAFYPDRLASRILGMGDVLSLIEQVEQTVDKQKAEQLVKKLKKGKEFDLLDLRDQLQQMRSMGGIGSLLDKLPGMGNMSQAIQGQVDDKTFTRMEAIINSMTPRERRHPDIINGSRKQRIAGGSGVDVPEVNKVLKQHKNMAKMMKKMKKGGLANMMRGMGGMMGQGGGMPRF
jgi:signal recognition particle subunit SRP54